MWQEYARILQKYTFVVHLNIADGSKTTWLLREMYI